MIPNSDTWDFVDESDDEMEELTVPTKTFKIDLENKRIIGYTDGTDAYKQAVYKLIQTEAEAFPIYSANYGVITDDLIGSNMAYAKGAVMLRLREAILIDERFKSVEFTNIEAKGRKLSLNVAVTTAEGDTVDVEGVEIDV